MMTETPEALMAMGACSRDEPQPKFLPPTITSPGETVEANSGFPSAKACFASKAPSETLQ